MVFSITPVGGEVELFFKGSEYNGGQFVLIEVLNVGDLLRDHN